MNIHTVIDEDLEDKIKILKSPEARKLSAYIEGYNTVIFNLESKANPYSKKTHSFGAWERGFKQGSETRIAMLKKKAVPDWF